MRFAILAALFALGCGGPSRQDRPFPRTFEYVSRAELASLPTNNLLDALQVIRPTYFRGFRAVRVIWFNEGPLPVSSLREFSLEHIEDIRWLSQTDAAMRYGPRYPGPALVLRMRIRSSS